MVNGKEYNIFVKKFFMSCLQTPQAFSTSFAYNFMLVIVVRGVVVINLHPSLFFAVPRVSIVSFFPNLLFAAPLLCFPEPSFLVKVNNSAPPFC